MAKDQADVVPRLQCVFRLCSWKCRDTQEGPDLNLGTAEARALCKCEVEQGILIEMTCKLSFPVCFQCKCQHLLKEGNVCFKEVGRFCWLEIPFLVVGWLDRLVGTLGSLLSFSTVGLFVNHAVLPLVTERLDRVMLACFME